MKLLKKLSKKSQHQHIFMKNGGVLPQYVYLLSYQFYQITNNKFIQFKLLRLLHDRIDPTVKILKKNPSTLKRKRVYSDKTPASVPPIGAQSWCLNEEALKRFNRSDANIPVYDYDTDDIQNNSNNDAEDEDNNGKENSNRTNSRKKRKTKKNKNKKRIKNINQNSSIFFFA